MKRMDEDGMNISICSCNEFSTIPFPSENKEPGTSSQRRRGEHQQETKVQISLASTSISRKLQCRSGCVRLKSLMFTIESFFWYRELPLPLLLPLHVNWEMFE